MCHTTPKPHQAQSCSPLAGERSALAPRRDVLFLHRATQDDAQTTAHFRHLCACVSAGVAVNYLDEKRNDELPFCKQNSLLREIFISFNQFPL